jgi:hypothetical protein
MVRYGYHSKTNVVLKTSEFKADMLSRSFQASVFFAKEDRGRATAAGPVKRCPETLVVGFTINDRVFTPA